MYNTSSQNSLFPFIGKTLHTTRDEEAILVILKNSSIPQNSCLIYHPIIALLTSPQLDNPSKLELLNKFLELDLIEVKIYEEGKINETIEDFLASIGNGRSIEEIQNIFALDLTAQLSLAKEFLDKIMQYKDQMRLRLSDRQQDSEITIQNYSNSSWVNSQGSNSHYLLEGINRSISLQDSNSSSNSSSSRSSIDYEDNGEKYNGIALYEAIKKGNISFLKSEKNQEYISEVINIKNDQQRSFLHIAVNMKKKIEIIQLLLDMGIDINAKDIKGKTALHLAAGQSNIGILKELVNRGADVHNIDKKARTPLHVAATTKNFNVIEYLVNTAKVNIRTLDIHGRNALHLACLSGNTQAIKLLRRLGSDLNDTDTKGLTALHIAVLYERTSVVKLLLELGAARDVKNLLGKTSLDIAIEKNKFEIAELLVRNNLGCDMDYKDKNGRTPLFACITRGRTKIAKLLIDNGANINIKDEKELTPLHLCVIERHEEIARLLLNKGVCVNAQDIYQKTALHYMFYNINNIAPTPSLIIAGLIINSGANVYIKDIEGKAFIDYLSEEPIYFSILKSSYFKIDNKIHSKLVEIINKIKDFYSKNKQEKLEALPLSESKTLSILMNNQFSEGKELSLSKEQQSKIKDIIVQYFSYELEEHKCNQENIYVHIEKLPSRLLFQIEQVIRDISVIDDKQYPLWQDRYEREENNRSRSFCNIV